MKHTVSALIGVIICAALLFCAAGCLRIPTEDPTREPVLTTPYGNAIPTYSDVEKTILDPDLFRKDEKGRMYYNDPTVPTHTGIDVSVFQGDIDWTAVKNDGIDFAILRAAYRGYGPEGKLGVDAKFEEYYAGAKAAGVKIGVYFFSQAITTEEALEEAEFLLPLLRGKEIDYPVAYDWEHIDYDDARTDDLPNETISQCAAAFCGRISEAGYDTLIYFNRELGYFNFDLSVVSEHPFWLAEYRDTPSFVYDYKIWQYTRHGSVNGIDVDVDIDLAVSDF